MQNKVTPLPTNRSPARFTISSRKNQSFLNVTAFLRKQQYHQSLVCCHSRFLENVNQAILLGFFVFQSIADFLTLDSLDKSGDIFMHCVLSVLPCRISEPWVCSPNAFLDNQGLPVSLVKQIHPYGLFSSALSRPQTNHGNLNTSFLK
jgi:hypothetical protein